MEEFDISKINPEALKILGYYWGDLTDEQLEQRKNNWDMKDVNGNPISFDDYLNSKGNRKILMNPQGNPASPTEIQDALAKYKNPNFKDRNHVDANSNEKIRQYQADQNIKENFDMTSGSSDAWKNFGKVAGPILAGAAGAGTIAAAAPAVGAALAPHAGNILAGTIGGESINLATRLGSNGQYKGWGDFIAQNLKNNLGIEIPEWITDFTNPGYLISGSGILKDGIQKITNNALNAYASSTGIEKAAGKLISYLKHPTWKTYYHGSSYPFDIKNFFRGTPQDYGLHMGDKNIATELSQSASAFQSYGIDLGYPHKKPTVYKFRAPRPSASTIDTHANDFRHLSENTLIKGGDGVRYDLHPGDKFTWKTFENSGAALNYFPNSDTYPFTTLSNDIRINMRKFFPKIKNNPEFNKRAQDIIDEATKMKKEGITSPMLEDLNSRIDLNTRTAELLSDAGYPVIKYENLSFGEVPTKFIRSNKPYYSYILTDPSKIDLMEPYKFKRWYTLPYINENIKIEEKQNDQ